ncbi:MAG: TlpA disulfide reductase family protein [Saprospiraceae bacterium]
MRRFLPLLLLLLAVGGYYLFRAWYFQPAVNNADTAPPFTARLIDGSPYQFGGGQADYVLLNFWGSWCGPCRAELPDLRRLSELPGLTIVSIAIERDSAAWRAALQRDNRRRPYQIMDASASLRFFSGPLSDLYGVNQVPTSFLIGRDGKIIAVNPELGKVAGMME